MPDTTAVVTATLSAASDTTPSVATARAVAEDPSETASVETASVTTAETLSPSIADDDVDNKNTLVLKPPPKSTLLNLLPKTDSQIDPVEPAP
ncbi:hypothetical protein Pcinc_023376 [Petrolisthes cinctipes]|uniref:Uncharacterized protein n=1 Tax=Petrolisthes cinctipes TaxID=88211 RepID=A0AAE1KCA9_PETCI|nr:hypothetical protein Pcinc_023376 [Petrolisthes cinctipes]